MHILWIHRDNPNALGGDAIYDRKLVTALRRLAVVNTMLARRNDSKARLLAMWQRRIPLDRAGFGTDQDIDAAIATIERTRPDAVVVSHEQLDYLPRLLHKRTQGILPPIYIVAHNIASTSYREIFPGLIGRALSLAYRLYERVIFRDKSSIAGIFCLSHLDVNTVAKISSRQSAIHLAMPGCPPPSSLNTEALFAPELLLLGSYDWFPKRWSLELFVKEWQDHSNKQFKLFVDENVSSNTRLALGAESALNLPFDAAIRVGLITDRFTAGHKLKTASYIMQNCAVLSYADVGGDFLFSRWGSFFIRRISHVKDIENILQDFSSVPAAELRRRLIEFKEDLLNHLSWERQSESVFTALSQTPT